MTAPAKLNDIIEGLMIDKEGVTSYLDKRTGRVYKISEEEFRMAESTSVFSVLPEWQQERILIARDITLTDNYLPLPVDIEYGVMEQFCLTLPDSNIREGLCEPHEGKTVFRSFQKNVENYRLGSEWDTYHHDALRQIAADWCRENDVPCLEG